MFCGPFFLPFFPLFNFCFRRRRSDHPPGTPANNQYDYRYRGKPYHANADIRVYAQSQIQKPARAYTKPKYAHSTAESYITSSQESVQTYSYGTKAHSTRATYGQAQNGTAHTVYPRQTYAHSAPPTAAAAPHTYGAQYDSEWAARSRPVMMERRSHKRRSRGIALVQSRRDDDLKWIRR